MNNDINGEFGEVIWQVGGQQGEGIDSTGDILASTLNQLGYYLYGYREFSSRIKGGHTHYRLRISDNPIGAISHKLHLLVALDQESLSTQNHFLVPSGIIIADENLNVNSTMVRHNVVKAPLTRLSEDLGNKIVKNMAALGISIAIMNLRLADFEDVINQRFSKKGSKVVALNLAAIESGFDWACQHELLGKLPLKSGDKKKRLFMIGNQAAALGAIMAGCRFISAYPITPATEIMEYLGRQMPEIGGAAIQAEDEIAAINMVLGASYAGVRAMTSTSGPGLSLMMETIGLSGMTETPVVIIDAQRGGPSTGLPTKHEQSDLLSAIFGTHGEVPKIVITPTSVSQCFYQTANAFNLAEKYQCPVIVLSDVALSLGKQTVEPFDASKIKVDRGQILLEVDPTPEDGTFFQRYGYTASGVSPRPLPGTKNGVHFVTGLEHDETGLPADDPALRTAMMDKRLNKIPDLLPGSTFYHGPDNPDYLLVGYGSTYGPIAEAREMMANDGLLVGHLHILIIWPFPIAELDYNMETAKNIFIIENNATGQLEGLLDMHSPYDRKTKPIRKYNGQPFVPFEIYQQIKERL